MSINKQQLLKLIGLFLVVYFFSFYLAFYLFDQSFSTNSIMGLDAFGLVSVLSIFLLSFIYIPLIYLFIKRVIENKNFEVIRKIYNIASWLFIYIIAISFILTLGEILFLKLPEFGFWTGLKYSIYNFFSWEYITDLQYGLLSHLKELLFYIQYLFVAALFYWSIRISKSLSISA